MKKGKSKAAEFWDHYFHDDFVRLERRADKYVGAIANGSGGPFSFLTGAKTTDIVLPISDLRSYDYATDPRFTLIAKVPSDIAAAYSAVEAQTYPYRDPAPFSPQRLAELLGEIRTACFHDSGPGITLSSVEKALSDFELISRQTVNHPDARDGHEAGGDQSRAEASGVAGPCDGGRQHTTSEDKGDGQTEGKAQGPV